MTTKTTNSSDGRAITTKATFSRETSVSTMIKASPEIIWALLTSTSDFTRWNSTIVSMEGEIAPGKKVAGNN